MECMPFSPQAFSILPSLQFEELALYIHIPFCKQKCSYCDFFSVTGKQTNMFLSPSSLDKPSPYARRIVDAVNLFKMHFRIQRFSSIYIGGGTPSLLSEFDISFLGTSLFAFAKPDAEITMELNPESVSLSFLHNAIKAGVNRFSLGVQTFSEKILSEQNRITNVADIERALFLLQELASQYEVAISVDLMLGFQNQTEKMALFDIERLIAYKIPHISVYTLCTDDYKSDIENDMTAHLFEMVKHILFEAGYKRYEVSNFALAEMYESCHNKAYWKMHNYIGVGPSAVGTIHYDLHNAGGINAHEVDTSLAASLRISCKANIDAFFSEPFPYELETISFVDSIKEYLLMGLRLAEGIDKLLFFERFKISLDQFTKGTINKYNSFIAINSVDRLALSERGLDFLSMILTDLFVEIDLFFRDALS